MMDPLTAISLVSGILSLVGATEKILKLTWTLYNSVEQSSEEIETRSKIANSMDFVGKLIIPTDRSVLTEADRALVTLAKDCNDLANDVKMELQGLKPKKRKSKAQSGLAALKTLIVEPKIKDLEQRLQRCRDQLHLHITALSK
jgi:hypothetical protein